MFGRANQLTVDNFGKVFKKRYRGAPPQLVLPDIIVFNDLNIYSNIKLQPMLLVQFNIILVRYLNIKIQSGNRC